MDLLFIIIAVFLIAKWLITSSINGLFGVNDEEKRNNKVDKSTTVINYNITNNNLHVNEDEYNRLKK